LAESKKNRSSSEGSEGCCAGKPQGETKNRIVACRRNLRRGPVPNSPPRARSSVRGESTLSANPHGAEAQDDMPAGGRPAKAHHRPESREQQHLVQLPPQIHAPRPRKNLISHHLAMLVHGHID